MNPATDWKAEADLLHLPKTGGYLRVRPGTDYQDLQALRVIADQCDDLRRGDLRELSLAFQLRAIRALYGRCPKAWEGNRAQVRAVLLTRMVACEAVEGDTGT